MRKLTVCLLSMQRIEETYGGIESFTCSLFDWLNNNGITALIASRRLSIFSPVKISEKYSIPEKSLQITGWRVPLPIYALGLIVCSLYSSISLIKFLSKKGVDLIHIQDPTFSGLAGIIVSKWFKIPLIAHLHGPPIYLMDNSFDSPIWKLIDTILTKITINNADVIFVTDSRTEQFTSAFTKRHEKIIRMPTAISMESFEFNNSKDDEYCKKDVVIGFIGRLSIQKNPLVILDAIENLNTNTSIEVLIAGNGPLKSEMENKLKSSKIKNKVVLLGAITEEEKSDLFKKIDIFVIPSLVEGCPIALLEAMAAGKAIVASDIPSIQEIVSDEVILIKPHNVEKLRSALALLCNNKELRHKLGAKAKDRARSFDRNLIYSKILKLYILQIKLKKSNLKLANS